MDSSPEKLLALSVRQPFAEEMRLTPYHAKYIAHELTRRCASDSIEKLTAVLSDAQVDLNPYQIEAALFAFRNPLSHGAILADEVGPGKTIEAGLLISQSWAEGKRRILIIVPANLRKQWSQELADKFFLAAVILETRTFKEAVRASNLNPFQQDGIVSRDIGRQKDALLDEIGRRLEQKTVCTELFTVRWRVV